MFHTIRFRQERHRQKLTNFAFGILNHCRSHCRSQICDPPTPLQAQWKDELWFQTACEDRNGFDFKTSAPVQENALGLSCWTRLCSLQEMRYGQDRWREYRTQHHLSLDWEVDDSTHHRTPFKGSKKKPLTDEQRVFNLALVSERIVVEQVIRQGNRKVADSRNLSPI